MKSSPDHLNHYNVVTEEYGNSHYRVPPVELLDNYSPDDIFSNVDRVNGLEEQLIETCRAFKIDATIESVNVSSMAITFSVRPGQGVSIKSFLKLKADFELHMASELEINDVGKKRGTIGIIVKNKNRPLIGLRSIIDTEAFKNYDSRMVIAAGTDIQGNPLYIDIEKAPHMLIAGSTGSGKSVFIDDILLSILYKAKPSEVKLILVDPKLVELNPYNGIPHLLCPVINNSDDAISYFLWLEDEMLKRYDLFSSVNAKNIESYNEYASQEGMLSLPRILMIIDEYMDLILDSPKEINQVIDRVARLGRAAGIHLILATQLPVAKIVTPQIKNNLPCRVSFTVVDGRESRIILDKTGAERLLGSGDMIYSRTDTGFVHGQAAYVSETELRRVIEFVRLHN